MRLRGLTLLLLLDACASTSPAASGLKAGVARLDITPAEPIRLSGYAGRKTPSEGVAQPLFARAFALEDEEGRRAVLVAADAIAVTSAITEEIAARVSESAGVPRERFALCTSHSHTAPAMTGVIPNILELKDEDKPVLERYTRFFIDQVVRAADQAVKDLAPATLSLGWTEADFGANRRTPGGPADPDVPVLRIASPAGKLRGLLYGYACHCTTLQFNRVSGDWAGYASEALEAAHGGVAGCLIGCGADQNPMPRSTLDLAQRHGRSLADEVSRLLRDGPWKAVAGPLEGRFATVELPFDKRPTREELLRKLETGPPQEQRLARRLLEKMPAAIPYPVQTLRVGTDLAWVILGGEVVVDYALRLKREYDPGRVWPVAYANDVPGYIPSERILAEGGYEGGGAMVWYGQPGRLATGVEDLVHRQIREFVPPAFRRPAAEPVRSPLGAAESLAALEVEPGFEVDLVAAEPQVLDPIHVSWDARGRMYATEMIDYPEGPPAGRIVRLEDADGDGRMDKAEVFAEGLEFPTSSMPWRNGILVTCDPDLFYLEDRDGDGRADHKQVLFTGFAGGNTQHRVNSLQWGIDNWVYGANGDSTATIRSVSHPSRPPVTMTFADFRFRPDTGEFEVLAEHSGYALAFDDGGQRFVSGSGPSRRHVVLDRALRDRNPFAPSIRNAQVLEPRSKLYPVSGPVERFNDPLDVGFFTAASGLVLYRGGIFPRHYQGNAFIGDSAGNLVHRDVLVRQGASWKAAPHTQPREFLASRDPWFRPVFLANGPDGALYVVDMYRAVIEHPEWIPNDIEKTLDLKAGNDRGRVYRVRHRSRRPFPVERLDALSSAELVARLESPNSWVRETAQRLLFERQDKGVIDRLARLAGDSASPLGRLHALWTLEGLGVRSDEVVGPRRSDPDPRVREAAVRLSDRLEAASIAALQRDPDFGVRLRLAARLGGMEAPAAVEALGDLLFDPANDDWVRAAAVLGAPEQAHRVLARLAGRIGASAPDASRMLPHVWRLAATVGTRNDAGQVRHALDLVLPRPGVPMAEWQMVALGGGVVDGVGKKTATPGRRLRELADAERLALAVEEAARMAENPKVVDGTRYDALLVLGVDASGRHSEVLRKYLSPRHSPELQSGAILGTSFVEEGPGAARLLLEHWASYAAAQREGVLDGLMRRPDRVAVLLEALEQKRVLLSELGDGRKEQLRRLSEESLKARAQALLAADTRADRQKVVQERRKSLELQGRRAAGMMLFQKHCAECHPVQGVGPQVGPDLVRTRKREREGLLLDILDPNASVAPNFVAYNLMTRDEVIHSGLVVSQSPGAVTLRLKGGVERTVPRDQVEELKSTGKSLMPEMFETVLSDQDLADLIEYLRQVQ
jgi:putative membrane-bound dehydrogenase-like protein